MLKRKLSPNPNGLQGVLSILGCNFVDDVAVCYITPKMAEQLLEYNTCNRLKVSASVDKILREILAGNYVDHGNTMITFDKDGVLTDGQYRLTAIVKAGETEAYKNYEFRCVVQINTPQSIYIDANRKARNIVENADICGEYDKYNFSDIKTCQNVIERAYEQTKDGYECKIANLTTRERIDLIHKSEHSRRKISSLEEIFKTVTGHHTIISHSPTAYYIKACFYNAYRNGISIKDLKKFADLYMQPSSIVKGTDDETILSLCYYLEENQGGCRDMNELRIKAFDYALVSWMNGVCVTDLGADMQNKYGKNFKDYKTTFCKWK